MEKLKAAIYTRVSTDEQTQANQIPVLQEWAAARFYEITDYYQDTGSAWQHTDQKQLKRLLSDARQGKFSKVLVWSLDRLTRGGPRQIFPLLDKLGSYNVQVISFIDSWTDQPNKEMFDLLLSVFSWYSHFESQRISDRTKAGMARAKAQGKHVGRPRKK